MEQNLQEILLEGEVVRWQGRPTPFKLLAVPARMFLLLTWGACLAALVLILGWLIPFYLRTERNMVDMVVLLVIVSFLPIMISIRPLLDKWSLERSTLYAITNYRVLALVKDELMFIPLSRHISHSIEARDGDAANLCFCAAVGQDVRKTLDNAVMGVRRTSATQASVPGMLFFHIHQPEALLGYLS